MCSLFRENGLPLYEQLTKLLRQQIANGEFGPDEKLPSEKQLSENYQVSRITAKQALLLLESEGLIYRVQGSGSFVAPKRVKRQLNQLGGFSEDLQLSGIDVQRRLLESNYKSPSDSVRSKLELAEGEMVLVVKRLMLLENETIAIFTSYHPEHLVRNLTLEELNKKGLYELISQRLGLKLSYADQVIELGRANGEEARLLGVPAGDPMFRVLRKTFLEDGKAIEYARSVFRGDRVEFYSRLEALRNK